MKEHRQDLTHSKSGFAVRSAIRLMTTRNPAKDAVHHRIAPYFSDSPDVLIIGTFPSPKSREFHFFYGHPQNRFWKVLAGVFDAPFPETREARLAFVRDHHLALWDTVLSCQITGASDTSIKHVIPNRLDELVRTYGIRHVFCTGKKAGALYEKFAEKETGIKAVVLPSTSPANCAWSLQRLIEAYRVIREAVDEEEEKKRYLNGQ